MATIATFTISTESFPLGNVFENYPDVQSLSTVDEVIWKYLMRVDSNPSYEKILKGITETAVILLSDVETAEEWHFEVQSNGYEPTATFQQYCREHDLPNEQIGLYTLSKMGTRTQYDLIDSDCIGWRCCVALNWVRAAATFFRKWGKS